MDLWPGSLRCRFGHRQDIHAGSVFQMQSETAMIRSTTGKAYCYFQCKLLRFGRVLPLLARILAGFNPRNTGKRSRAQIAQIRHPPLFAAMTKALDEATIYTFRSGVGSYLRSRTLNRVLVAGALPYSPKQLLADCYDLLHVAHVFKACCARTCTNLSTM